MGSPKTTIPISSSSTTRWRVGSSGTTSSTPRPALANPDVGHLINSLALGLHLGTPRINTFSGKAMLGKTDVSFEQWYHEVQCIKDHYPESVVWESIVPSLNPYHTKGFSQLVSTSTKHDYSHNCSKCSSMPSGTIVLY